MQYDFKQPIFVLGLPRSGTSMVAGALKLCGAWAGTTVAGGGTSNPRGFFEHIVLRENIIKKLLVELGCDPLGVVNLPPQELDVEVPNLAYVIDEMLKLDGYKSDRPWMFKDVKLTLLWPLFLNAYPLAKWVVVKRNKDDIVRSCLRAPFMKQHSTKTEFWEKFIDDYLLRLDFLQQATHFCYELRAEEIVSGQLGSLRKLTNDLGMVFEEDAVRNFVAPKFWHGTSATT